VTAGPSDGAVHFERRAMGSPLRLTLVGVTPDRAPEAWAAVSDQIEGIEQALSRFRPTSDLVRLNSRAGDPTGVPVHPWLVSALAAAERARRVTGGAFDPRILHDLERLGYAGVPVAGASAPSVPSRRTVRLGERLATFSDGRWLRCDPRRSTAAVALPVDLGGIGKGLALRWAALALSRAVPELDEPGTGTLLEAGGDLVARGDAPQGGPWMVAIEDPFAAEEPAIVALHDGAICTSSIAVHRWRTADGREVHHLLDPRTGEPGGAGLASVTVSGPDPAWAEVWSKTLFLEGSADIGASARALGLAAWWVRDDGSLEMTPAARERTAWVRGES
jgi:thiamine biosynthesis lipoprotein